MSSNAKIVTISLVFLYFIAQIVMPKLGLSVILNFDTSCYSGAISYIERVNTSGGSSCGGSGSFVGFPFVINFDYNTITQKLLTGVVDLLPIIGLVMLLKYYKGKGK